MLQVSDFFQPRRGSKAAISIYKSVECEALLGTVMHKIRTEGLMYSQLESAEATVWGQNFEPDADEAPDLTELDERDIADPLEGFEDDLMDDYDDFEDDDFEAEDYSYGDAE